MNAVRRIDLSTLKLGIGPEGQVSLRSKDMSCLSLSLSYVENSLISFSQLCFSEKTEVGVEGKVGKVSGKENNGFLRVNFLCFRCVLAVIAMSPTGYNRALKFIGASKLRLDGSHSD